MGNVFYFDMGFMEYEPVYRLQKNLVDLICQKDHPETLLLLKNKKIASIGVRIKNGVSYHGVALNVNTDLERFKVIKPCGLNVVMTSMEEVLSKKVFMDRIKNEYINYFETCFDVTVIEKQLNCLDVISG